MSVESDVMLFMNHGCNGTHNYGDIEEDEDDVSEEEAKSHQLTEINVDLEDIRGITQKAINKAEVPYSPVFDRNWRHALNSGDYTLRDMKKGEEIFTNYLSFVGDINDFSEDLIR